MAAFTTKPLDETTWPDFAALVERHNGVWGGCWCMSFHQEGFNRKRTAPQNRSDKEARVRDGRAHAALVFDGEPCVGWCQFGPTDELPRIKAARAYAEGLTVLPDWRITCFLVDKAYRRKGWQPPLLPVRWSRSSVSAEGRWRAIPKTPKAARCRRPSCTMARSRCSSSRDFRVTAASARTAGSCQDHAAEKGRGAACVGRLDDALAEA